MKSTLVAGVALGLILAASPSFAAKRHYKANIEGGAVGSAGTGVGNFTFDDVTKRLCGKATYQNLEGGAVTAVALKEADNHTIIEALTASLSPILVDVTLTDAQIPLLDTGPIYIAIGNATHAVGAGEGVDGEVNGELLVDDAGVDQCPNVTDAGSDSGTVDSGPSSSGTSGTSGTSGDPSGTSNGDPPPPVEEEEDEQPAPKKKKDDGGCSTTGSSSTGTLAVVAAAISLLVAKRSRRR